MQGWPLASISCPAADASGRDVAGHCGGWRTDAKENPGGDCQRGITAAGALQAGGFREEVIVLGNEDAAQSPSAQEKIAVGQTGGAAVLSGEDIVGFAREDPRDGERNMDIAEIALTRREAAAFDMPEAALAAARPPIRTMRPRVPHFPVGTVYLFCTR